MHIIKDVTYISGYKLAVLFDEGIEKIVDLENHLDGKIFEPLKNIEYFKTVQVNPDTDTITWDNEADFSPDFLFKIGKTNNNILTCNT